MAVEENYYLIINIDWIFHRLSMSLKKYVLTYFLTLHYIRYRLRNVQNYRCFNKKKFKLLFIILLIIKRCIIYLLKEQKKSLVRGITL